MGAVEPISPRLRYTPASSNAPDARWIYQELLRISAALEDVRQSVLMYPQAGPLPKPVDGMLMQADGSTWDPGQGAGLYQYLDGAWQKLRGGLASDEAFYFGGSATTGSWRIVRNGDDLEMQRYEGGSWVMKQRIEA